MEKDARYFTVGLFVSLCLAALVGFVIWLAGPRDEHQYTRYTVYFDNSVNGLAKDADVRYMGVDVGKVEDLRLAPEKEDLVKVDIAVADTTPVHEKTQVALKSQGLTGVAYLELTPQPDDTKPPMRREGEAYPVLIGSDSEWDKVMADLPVITQQAKEAAIKANSFLGNLFGGKKKSREFNK